MSEGTKQTLIYISLFLVVIVTGVLVYGFIVGWFKPKLKLVDGEGEVDRLPGGAVDVSRYNTIARNVRDSLKGVNYDLSPFVAICDQLLSLNPNELRVVHNEYLTDYADNDYPTLRSRIQREWVGSNWSFGGMVNTVCTQYEKEEINSPCYKQDLTIKRLNAINA